MLWLIVIAGLLLALGQIAAIAAVDSIKKDLQLHDYAALLGPWVAAGLLIVFVVFLPWKVAVVLSLTVVALAVWGFILLLKVPIKRRAR